MKKLMIAAAVAFAAVALQATTVNWNASAIYDTTKDQNPVYCATAYLILSATITQDALVKAMTKSGYETTVADYRVAQVTTQSDGQILGTFVPLVKSVGGGAAAYFVLFNNGNMYVSEEQNFGGYNEFGDCYSISFGNQDGSLNEIKDSKGGYLGQNYYHPAEEPEPVPEPFSGSLALLGMGAIALRRKMKKA